MMMHCSYKRFLARRASLPLLCAFVFMAFCSVFAGAGFAAALFTVDRVQVDVTADNALAAREEAFDLAQRKAFTQLVDRLSPNGAAAAEIDLMDTSVIASMIKDYEIIEEKISDVRYIGTYTFRFRSSAVKRFFSGQSLTYSDLESDPIMILPFYQVNGRYDLWSYGNRWKDAWDRVNGVKSLVPVIVPVGDLQDVSDMRDDQAMTYQTYRLRALTDRYGAKETVIAVAVPDSSLIQSIQGGGAAQGSLIIKLYRTDESRPVLATQFFIRAEPNDTHDSLFDRGVQRVQSLLRENWKAQTMVNAGQMNNIQARISIASLQDWVRTEKKLKAVSAVEDVLLESLTAQRAVVNLQFEGDLRRLQMALNKQGMKLATLQANDVRVDQTIPMYELK